MTNYKTVLDAAFEELGLASEARRNLETKCAKLRQFIMATLNMLPDEERVSFLAKLSQFYQEDDIRTASLTDAIRRVLQSDSSVWRTAAEVRDRLTKGGFDFSGYTANPLASISTTLKRLKPGEVEIAEIEGVSAYRWKKHVFRRLTQTAKPTRAAGR